MRTFISLLRGINVGGQKRIRMGELVAWYESLNFRNVKTCLQSGNVVFDSRIDDPGELAALLEERIAHTSGVRVHVIIRTAGELRHVVADNPFLQGQDIDAGGLHVTFLSRAPSGTLADAFRPAHEDPDRFVLLGKEVYLYCPHGYGRTKFSNTFFEKTFGVIATTRNWRTVTRLLGMAQK